MEYKVEQLIRMLDRLSKSNNPQTRKDVASVGYALDRLKDDVNDRVRAEVAYRCDDYHDQYKDDPSWRVRATVAISERYHDQLKDDPSWEVRVTVASFSTDQAVLSKLANDPDSMISKIAKKELEWLSGQIENPPSLAL